MRVLFCGDAAGTGFGTVTRDLGKALLAIGEDVRFMSINEQGGPLEEPFRGRTALLGEADGWLAMSEDPETARRTAERLEGMVTGGLFEDGWTPDAVLLLGDMGSLKASPVLQFIPQGFPALHYVPVEGHGLPPNWAGTWRRLQPVAMCEFGADQIERVTGERPPVAYHGVSGEDFWPVSALRPIYMPTGRGMVKLHSKADAKRFFGLEGRTVALRTDRLMPRKNYPSLLRAMAPVLRRHPELDLVLHARLLDEGGDLLDMMSHHGDVAARIKPTGFAGEADRRMLNALYNAADLYVTTSAEGFGLCIAEALMCGVPVVGMDYSSVPEVVGPAGVTVPVGSLVDNIYSHFWARPDERAFSDAVERLVSDRAERERLGALGPDHVRKSFRWDAAAAVFRDLFRAALPVEAAA